MEEYSALKAAWHTDKIENLRLKESVVPAHVQLIISDLCNQNCHFCAYRMDGGFSTAHFSEQKGGKTVKNPNRMIPRDKVFEIIADCSRLGVKAIQFTGGGEPTVHPDHLEFFDHARWHNLRIGLVTNGLIMRDVDAFTNLDWVRISLDAGTEKTYAKVRESTGFNKVITNIDALASRVTNTVLGVGFVITLENWHEMFTAANIVRECGVGYIRLAAMFSDKGTGYYEDKVEDILAEIKVVKTLETDTFKVVDLFSHRMKDLDEGSPDYSLCGYQHFTIYVAGNLNVYRCCTTSYTDNGLVGNLANQSFRDWFFSTERLEKYNEFNAKSCHHCQFNAQNRIINYLVGDPRHVDFV